MALVLDGTNGVSGVDGTASSPSLEGTDSNTGIFYPAADTVAIGTGGTEALRVNSSQNVGIGTTSITSTFKTEIQQSTTGWSNLRLISPSSKTSTTTEYPFYITTSEAWASNPFGLEISLKGNATSSSRVASISAGTINSTTDGILALNPLGGNVGIGTSSPSVSLHVSNATDNVAKIRLSRGVSSQNYLQLQMNGGDSVIVANGITGTNGTLVFGRDAATGSYTESARITDAGAFVVAKTSAVLSIAGSYLQQDGFIGATRDGNACIGVNRLSNDGTLIFFQQAGVEEGTISVSGTTVSYNGGHLARWSQLLSGQRDESIVKGTVLSNLDEMCEWLDAEGNPLPNEQLNRTKVSDVEGDTNVAGVFVNWDNDDQDNPYDMNIAMTGDMIIRIAQGITVQKGDLLMSAGDGTAKPQGDDIVRSKTVAKVTSNHVTCTYDDGSYCVPCVLMAC